MLAKTYSAGVLGIEAYTIEIEADVSLGLPAYPNLTSGVMDKEFRTEALGRWCARFVATSSDSLLNVEAWYRKTLLRASETDLTNDGQYRSLSTLSGIKLAMGTDYVAVYRIDSQQTYIELHRCDWNR